MIETTDKHSEADVGISYYMNPSDEKVSGIMKNRWEDFHVREVDTENVQAKIDYLDPLTTKMDEEYVKKLTSDQIIELDKIIEGKIKEFKFRGSEDKDERTSLHYAIKAYSPKLSTSCSKDEDGTLWIIAKPVTGHERRSKDLTKEKPFCKFVLMKQGLSFNHALQVISKKLNIKGDAFIHAGTKDKRGITYQFVSIKGCEPSRLARLNDNLGNMKLGNYEVVAKPLFLGDLKGNYFTLAIRNISADKSKLDHLVDLWKKDGFVNYFGLQRFGHSASASSWKTGRFILKSEWKNAIELILTPTDADSTTVRTVKQLYKDTNDVETCASGMPFGIEKQLLWGVLRYGKTAAAIQTLSRNLRTLYGHSYQSYIWNFVVTERINRYGKKPVVGDIVLIGDEDQPTTLERKRKFEEDENVVDDSIVVITEENIANYSIEDVVLPMPGYAVKMPENDIKNVYEELLAKDELTLSSFKHPNKDFALAGVYRKIVVKPTNVEHEYKIYTDVKIPLIETDYEKLLRENPNLESKSNMKLNRHLDGDDENSQDGEKNALVISFYLPKSSYATMAIRELIQDVTVKD